MDTKKRRRSIRLDEYDYRDQGPYFITICASNRQLLFGEILDYEMILNETGRIVDSEWGRSDKVRPGMILDAFVVMPNHLHGIVVLANDIHTMGDGRTEVATGRTAVRPYRPPRSLGAFVAGFKSATTKRINEHRGTPRVPVWQRNYYEHIIRSETALNRARNYIETNPQRWESDSENPANHVV